MASSSRLTAALLLAGGVLVVIYWKAYRPWSLTWGATAAEVGRAMPGDAIVPHPVFDATRAVTIRARPEDIWPWLVQMGYRRAGFYSYDRLDNDGIPSTELILPEYQQVKEGDLIPLSRTAFVRVHSIEPYQSMVWVFETEPNATWAWGLYPLGPRETRLVSRLRGDGMGPGTRFIADTFEIVMMRKCLLGIKRRAEALAVEKQGRVCQRLALLLAESRTPEPLSAARGRDGSHSLPGTGAGVTPPARYGV